MHILYVNSFYSPDIGGGAEITLASIVEGVGARGHTVSVFATGRDNLLEGEVVGLATVYRAKSQNIYWPYKMREASRWRRAVWHLLDRDNRRMGRVLGEVIDRIKPDVIACHNLAGISIAAWREGVARGIPVVQVLHDLYLACPATTMFKNGGACVRRCGECHAFRLGFAKASSKLSAAVGVSDFIRGRLNSLGYFEGVDFRVIHNARPIGLTERRKPTVEPRSLVFGYIGSLTPAKGMEWLLRQFGLVGGGAKLVVAGSGEPAYEARLRDMAAGLNVEFVGHVNAQSFFSSVDVCVVPSVWPDTFPGVAFEACAYHVPVIASKLGGLPEIVVNGVNGLLVDPEVPSSLSEAMVKLSNDQAYLEGLADRCHGSVASFIDMDRMIDQYIDLYGRVSSRCDLPRP